MTSYNSSLRIYPVTLLSVRPKTDMECGGKVVLPVSVLHVLSSRMSFLQLTQQCPMLFSLTVGRRATHCGVLEFTGEEGHVHAPAWVLDTLQVEVGDPVQITAVKLPKATFARFQPQCTDFLDISDPRAVLENHLRGFACLTTGDVIPIHYNNRTYYLKVEETRPAGAVCINECDMEVDFSPPVGYVPPTTARPNEVVVQGGSIAFSGLGHRLDGKKPKTPEAVKRVVSPARVGQPNYDYRVGTIEFFRSEVANDDGGARRSSRSVD